VFNLFVMHFFLFKNFQSFELCSKSKEIDFLLKYLFWILIHLHTKITSFLGNMVHTVLVLYTGSMTYGLLLCCPSFLCFDAVGYVLQCSEYVPYRFLGWSNIIFWKISLPTYNCFGISIFRQYGEKLWKIYSF